MHRLYYIMGKSATGKDTIYRELHERFGFQPLILYTTRPMRQNEENGREYFFIDRETLHKMYAKDQILESRSYETVHGIWTYCTARNFDLDSESRFGVGTIDSYLSIREKLGAENIVPIYIEVDDRTRLLRAIERESREPQPNYEELCRRFLADAKDFSEMHLAGAGITRRFINDDLAHCLAEIEAFIRTMEETQ